VIGNRMTGQGWEDISLPVAEAKAMCQAGRIRLQDAGRSGGTHGLWLKKAEQDHRYHFIKATALPLDVARGRSGPVHDHLKGVGWTETANIMHEVYDNSYNGYVCAFNSQGDVEINMQASGAPGWHFIDLLSRHLQSTETDPNISAFRSSPMAGPSG